MSLAFDLSESETKILLESLIVHERALQQVCETSDDEDLVADTGNDLIELRLLLKTMRDRAVAQFGDGVLSFSKVLL